MKNLYSPIFAALLLLGLAACDKLNPVNDTAAPGQSAAVWQVSINAVKGADTKALEFDETHMKILTSFKTTDFVYVYNKTKAALDGSVLHPESDGASVTISGSLSGSYSVGDELELRYSPYFSFDGGVFDYEEQTGAFETMRDFGVATVSVTAVDGASGTLTVGDAHFTNPHSIFRFTFVDMDTGILIPVNTLYLSTVTGKLVFMDSPDGTRKYYGPMDMETGTFPWERWLEDTTDPVWLSICYEAPATNPESDWMHFSVLDEVHKYVYDMAKPMDGKITNGKFYTPTIQMMVLPKPDVTLSASGDPVEPTMIWHEIDSERGYYNYTNPGSDITISGFGDQCHFVWSGTGGTTVRFKGATTDEHQFFVCNEHPFIEHKQSGTLTIDLDGNTDIICDDPRTALIKLDRFAMDVAFQGNGTLSIMASNTIGTKGFVPADYSGNIQPGVPTLRAADGYTLEISDGVDNGNGTSTWTFTVSGSGGSTGSEMKLPPTPFNLR